MPDELTLLREIGSGEKLSPHTEERLRQELLDRIAAGATRRTRRWPLRAALVLAAVVVVAVAGALLQRGGEPSVAARAFAAITPTTGIMHFVAEYPPVAKDGTEWTQYAGRTYYMEYWIDLAHPKVKRFVTTRYGRVTDQYVFVNHAVRAPGGAIIWSRHPRTYIQAGYPAPVFWPGTQSRVDEGVSPVDAYRELLRHGVVESQKEIDYHGHDAYELKIVYKPPYDLVDDIWTGDRQTYVVDRGTYYPLESSFHLDPAMGGYGSIARYPVFEILPATAQNLRLLEPAKNPQPYHP